MITNNPYYAKEHAIRANSRQTRIPNSIATMNVITVFEHQRLTVYDFLQASDFDWLMVQEFAVFTIKRKQGQWQLKVGHYIGIILLPSGITLEILPKLNQSTQSNDIVQTRHWVQGMLSDLIHLDAHNNRKLPNTKNFGQFSSQSTPLPLKVLPISDWLIEQFLQRLMDYQPTKHYQAQIENQASLQGRLLIKEQLRHNSMQPHKFICKSSVLSHDMLANRLIRSALVYLMPLLPQFISSKLLQPWQQVSTLNNCEMQQIAVIYAQAKRQLDVQPLQKQKLHAAQQLVDLAYWLLKQTTAATGNGIDPSRQNSSQLRLCLLIDMNQAFEQWASQRIASMFQQISSSYRPFYQTQSVWLNDAEGLACLSIRPDLLIFETVSDDCQNQNDIAASQTTATEKNKGRYSHVIDIKWKYLPHAAAVSASDAYQLTSYAQAYLAGQVWLVYPVLGSDRQPVALKQQTHYGSNDSSSDDVKSNKSINAHLWLMPFDVLTGTLNGEVLPHLDKA
ncbi:MULTISPECIES: McrC family protein [unclassified Psychrobacter]|uniref:McrC family protein n=2 Tax=Psychrobacter TaxID=497 RepID=UPI001E43DAD7|nr:MULTISPECIES: McrC family protein [unclassified Psychrobacter]